jgi:hypothetical protein
LGDRITPDSADSTANGTLMRSGRVTPNCGASSVADWRSCHSPLRFCQSGRVICGRGYSGSGVPLSACAVQGVVSGGVLAGTACAGTGATSTPAAETARSAAAARSGRRNADMGDISPPWG